MRFKRWIPIQDITKRLYLEGLCDDFEGFRLLLREENGGRMLRISFEYAIAYCNTDEGNLLKTINMMNKEDLHWDLFTIKDSNFIKWHLDQRYEEKSHLNLIHYGIYTSNDCVDVLSSIEPTVEWLNE